MTVTAPPATDLAAAERLVEVGRLDGLTGPVVVSGGRHGIVVFVEDGKPYAVDNRCPHMGFPLDRGTVRDGILTCHWHHARFDLASGGAFDLFAGDVQAYPTVVRDGVVYVDPSPAATDPRARWRGRLEDGIEQNLNLLTVKAVLALHDGGTDPTEIVAIGARFGTRYREAGWRSGLTILTAMTNLLPFLRSQDQVLALYHGMVNVANDCAGQPPHFRLDELPSREIPPARIQRWFRSFVEVRDRDGAERALLTALQAGMEPAEVAGMLFTAATDHYFLDGGHSFDFINKACELLDHVGWDQAADILPSIVPSLTNAQRAEELNSWRYPIDLVALVDEAAAGLPETLAAPRDAGWNGMAEVADALLQDDPHRGVQAIQDALAGGAPLTAVTRSLAYAAGLRVARFHTSNEFGDWITVLHTFSYANALHQAMRRAPSLELARGIYHGAMRVYLDRFLNMPAAKLPEHRNLDGEPTNQRELLDKLLELTDREQQVNEAALVTQRYLSLGHDPAELIAALGHVLLREDGEFHSYQMLEAGVALERELRPLDPAAANRMLVAVTRYLAAHAPTSRSMMQTARTALRLHRGENVYEPPSEADE
jgi:nitrite reductase/ring-hydroxylating ferredoxin subunit